MFRYIFSSIIGVAVFLFLLSVAPAHAQTVSADALQPGDLIRNESRDTVYYYGRNGMRYVFPNSNTYFTWYDDFDEVKWISDDDLTTIQIGGNVTYRPGVKMIKIQSDPTTYVVEGNGQLRGLTSETVAADLYGSNWNDQIDDMPDGFFTNYTIGEPLDLASRYSPEAERAENPTINRNKGLREPIVIKITNNGYDQQTVTIDQGRAIRWEHAGNTPHSVTENDGIWGSGTMQPGEHFTRQFHTRGRYFYNSKYAPKTEMQGSIYIK